MYELLILILIYTTQIFLIECKKEETCTNKSKFQLPKDGQAFYSERKKYSGLWHYSTPDGWIRRDELPKDELPDAEDNWPMWIWHDCGRSKSGYDLVCIESGRYPNYYAYTSGSNLAISYSANPRGSDWTWTHFYVESVYDDGYVFLCNVDDGVNCDGGFGGYFYVPPTCAGYERVTCCKNLDCSFSYESGITKTRGNSITTTFGADISATVSFMKYRKLADLFF